MPVYLAIKEMLRNKGRFLLFSMVIALITLLVLFTAALSEGLGSGNREYIQKLNGELIVFKKGVDLSASASRIDRAKFNEIRRVAGVDDAGMVSFTSVSAILPDPKKPINVSLIGVEPGKPGEPPVLDGRGFEERRAVEAIVDKNFTQRTGLGVGDDVTIKSIQGTKEQFYSVKIVGVTDGRQYFLAPSIIVPIFTFEKIKPNAGGGTTNTEAPLVGNVVAVKLANPEQWKEMSGKLQTEVTDIVAVDRKTAYENTPGYSAQQNTLSTQNAFSFLIGILVIGGFFQIQMLQKVPQIGMLKAIGASNTTVGIAAVVQIIVVTMIGVGIGTALSLLLSLSFPAGIPIVFTPAAVGLSVAALLATGPLGGLVSVRYALQVEPLKALGLT
jgi:putative ABC transport system permease protein